MGAVKAQAAGIYLTFEGYVTERRGYTDVFTEHSITDGMAVSYLFYVDTGADGSGTRNAGNTDTATDTVLHDYYFVDLISDPYLYTEDGFYNNEITNPDSYAEFNIGTDAYSGQSQFDGSSSNDLVRLTENFLEGGIYPTSFSIGDLWTGFDATYDSLGLRTSFYSALTLTAISDTNPISAVPVPAAAWLFGTALLGFAGTRLRRRKLTA